MGKQEEEMSSWREEEIPERTSNHEEEEEEGVGAVEAAKDDQASVTAGVGGVRREPRPRVISTKAEGSV